MRDVSDRINLQEQSCLSNNSAHSSSGAESITLEEEMPVQEKQLRRKRIRLSVLCVLLLCLSLIVVDSFTSKRVESVSKTFLDWVEQHPARGVVAVIVVYTIATSSILSIGTGFAFGAAFDSTAKGVALASMAVFIGASLGSIASFLLGRYLFRDCVLHLASSYPIFQAVDRALQGNGLKIMILLRLSPLIPYNALDYMSGLTSISIGAYTVALIALLPGIVMFTFVGAAASLGTKEATGEKTARLLSTVFGVVFAILGVAVASYYSKLELDKILESEQADASSSPLKQHEMGSFVLHETERAPEAPAASIV